MFAHDEDGWYLLHRCVELTDALEAALTADELPIAELFRIEQLYTQRQRLLERLAEWWDAAPYRAWTPEQAQKWLDVSRQLVERSTRHAEQLRSLLRQCEQRLQAALRQRQCVRYCEGDTDEY